MKNANKDSKLCNKRARPPPFLSLPWSTSGATKRRTSGCYFVGRSRKVCFRHSHIITDMKQLQFKLTPRNREPSPISSVSPGQVSGFNFPTLYRYYPSCRCKVCTFAYWRVGKNLRELTVCISGWEFIVHSFFEEQKAEAALESLNIGKVS